MPLRRACAPMLPEFDRFVGEEIDGVPLSVLYEATDDKADEQGCKQRQPDSPGVGCLLSASFEPIWLGGTDCRRQPLNEPGRDPA
jgi:hypothetical protein